MQVLDRGEKIELLVDKTENLQFQVLAVPYLIRSWKSITEFSQFCGCLLDFRLTVSRGREDNCDGKCGCRISKWNWWSEEQYSSCLLYSGFLSVEVSNVSEGTSRWRKNVVAFTWFLGYWCTKISVFLKRYGGSEVQVLPVQCCNYAFVLPDGFCWYDFLI